MTKNEPVHLEEPVLNHIIQSFIYREVYYFTEPSEGMVVFWFSLKVKQFLSNNQPLKLVIGMIYWFLYLRHECH